VAREALTDETIQQVYEAIPHLIRFPGAKFRVDYDREADVLYLSLKRPQRATDTQYVEDEGLLLRYRGEELVGITVLDASKRRAVGKGA